MSAEKPAEPLNDLGSASPIFVDGLGAVQPFGSVTHLLFTARQSVNDGKTIERVVQVRLVVPNDQLQTIAAIIRTGRLDLSAGVDETGNEVAVH